MQDFDLREGEEKPIASLFIEAPGAKTIKDNLDHFTKREHVNAIDPYWAAAALYTMQSFAPSGGVGHRVGVRGGGPLTTLVLPKNMSERSTTLWEKLWLNVLPKNDIASTCKSGNYEKDTPDAIFPWLKPSKISDCEGSELLPNECHPLHVYFAMPRRVRLCFSKQPGICSLTGKQCDNLVTGYITKNYGNNYSGPWVHPLNAYRYDPRKPEEPPLSIKGQPGGVHYRHWLAHTLGHDNVLPASVVKCFQSDITKKMLFKNRETILWAAGYDMDNMKARSWHESVMPHYCFEKDETIEFINCFAADVTTMIDTAKEISDNLRSAVRKLWFKDPSSAAAKKADFSFLDDSFTQKTEREFYELIKVLMGTFNKENNKDIRSTVGKKWLKILQVECLRLIEQWCLIIQEWQKDLHKVFQVHKYLYTWINFGKGVKMLRAWYENSDTKEIDKEKKGKKKKSSAKGGIVND
jgi:CRISPR system Cascade subunit CasA